MTVTVENGSSQEWDPKTAKDKLSNDAEHKPLLAHTVSFRVLFRKNWFATCVYCSVFCSFGICVAILGPTLTDLGCLTMSDIKSMSWVFFAQFLFCLVGSMLSGYLVNRRALSTYDTDILIFFATIVMPLMMVIIPFCRAIGLLAVVLAVMGLCMGCLDCLANVQMINTFGEAVTPFLQAMHFFYGLGAFISPMIAEPFIYNTDCSLLLHEISNYTDNTDTFIFLTHPGWKRKAVNSTFVEEELKLARDGTQVRFAFWIISAIMIPIPFLVAMLIMRKRQPNIEHETLIESESNNSLDLSPTKEDDRDRNTVGLSDLAHGRCFTEGNSRTFIITIGIALMLFIYDGLQSSFGAYVYSYALKSIVGLEKTEGAYLNASFWGAFAFGRLLSIFIATRFNPAFMLCCNTIGSFLAMLLMVSLPHNHTSLYFGTCMFGLFLSSVTPTALSLAEQYVDLSSSNTAVIVTVAATGEMLMPVIVGNAFATFGPSSLLVNGNIMTFLSILVFVFIWMKGRTSPKLESLESPSFVWCQSYIVKKRRCANFGRKSFQSQVDPKTAPDENNLEMAAPK